MILAVVLAALLLLFLLVRNHVGVPFLAMIAGVSVYEAFGVQFAETINQWIPAIDPWWARLGLYLFFVFAMPLILYLRSGKSGLFGVPRIIEAVIFALLLTILIADPLASLFSFDNYARDIANWIEGIRGIIMIVGVIFAYVDVLFFRSGKIS